MTLDVDTLRSVIDELQPLCGGRIQRVDLIAPNEVVLELRYPGRTLRLLISARPGQGRAHLVDARPPKETAGGDLQRVLRKRLEGKPLVALEADRHTVIVDARDHRLLVRLDGKIEWAMPSGRDLPPMPETVPEHFPKSEEVAKRFETRLPEDAALVLRRQLTKQIDAKAKKLRRLIENLGRDTQRLEQMSQEKELAELMKPELGKLARGATEARVTDWSTGVEKTIALDPALSAKANMEKMFARAKKAERGRPIVAERIRRFTKDVAELDALREEIAKADLDRLHWLAEARAEKHAPREPRPTSVEKKKPIDRWSRRFEASDGSEIRVGRGAKENDRLTLSIAKGDDVWLHASGTQGAHVLIRVQKGATASPEALLDAAHLAAHYSGAKNASKVEVVWTEARYVKKTKGDPPGRVSVAKGRTILVAIDPARIDRLFARELTPKAGG